MKIQIARGTISKDETYKFAELLVRAGYEVCVRKGTEREDKSTTYIIFKDLNPDPDEEDLS